MDSSLELISQSSLKTGLPQFKVGMTVRIHQRIKEGDKERVQVFEGLIIQMRNGRGINGTITVRKLVDGIGVERIFPIHSANIAKIEITKQAKVRRSKLFYMRERTGKSARMKNTQLEGQVFIPKSMAEVQAAKAAEEEAAATVKADAEAKAAADAPAVDEDAPEKPSPEAPPQEAKEEKSEEA